VLLCFEAAGHGNIQHAHVSGPQDLFCPLDAMAQDELVWTVPVDLRNICELQGAASVPRDRVAMML
jgi:hypothetical protein